MNINELKEIADGLNDVIYDKKGDNHLIATSEGKE
jgi:hypothetical protein